MNSQLDLLLSEGILDEVLGRLKSGKEAEVFRVRYRGEVVAAKVYKDRTQRSFQHNVAYKEGRKVRNSRTQRAIDKGSRFGRDEAEDAWKSSEANTLQLLHRQGVRVPTPVLFYEGVLLMELVLDADGDIAPRLIEAAIEPEHAGAIYRDLRSQIIKVLCCDLIHGDLSPYNVLLGTAGPTIIDFPQAIAAAHNLQSETFFQRDFENIFNFFAEHDRRLLAQRGDGREIWRAYARRELSPDYEPVMRPPPRAPQPQAQAPRDQRFNGPRYNDQRPSDQRFNEPQPSNQQFNGQRNHDPRFNEQRSGNPQLNGPRNNEQRFNGPRNNEQRPVEPRTIDQRTLDQRLAEQRINEQRNPEQRPRAHRPEEHVPVDQRFAEERPKDHRAEEQRQSDQRGGGPRQGDHRGGGQRQGDQRGGGQRPQGQRPPHGQRQNEPRPGGQRPDEPRPVAAQPPQSAPPEGTRSSEWPSRPRVYEPPVGEPRAPAGRNEARPADSNPRAGRNRGRRR